MTEPSRTEHELGEIMLEVRQYLINTEFSPEPFTEPVDVGVLKVEFPKKILAHINKAGWKSPEECEACEAVFRGAQKASMEFTHGYMGL